jgi:hypothetical protein
MPWLAVSDPSKRLTAEKALLHPYFKEKPLPTTAAMMPTFPSLAETKLRTHQGQGQVQLREQLQRSHAHHRQQVNAKQRAAAAGAGAGAGAGSGSGVVDEYAIVNTGIGASEYARVAAVTFAHSPELLLAAPSCSVPRRPRLQPAASATLANHSGPVLEPESAEREQPAACPRRASERPPESPSATGSCSGSGPWGTHREEVVAHSFVTCCSS